MFLETFLHQNLFPESIFNFSGNVQLHQIRARRWSGDQECHLCSRLEHDQWQGVNCYYSSYSYILIFACPHVLAFSHFPIPGVCYPMALALHPHLRRTKQVIISRPWYPPRTVSHRWANCAIPDNKLPSFLYIISLISSHLDNVSLSLYPLVLISSPPRG